MIERPTRKLSVILERHAVESRWETHQWQLLGVVPDVGGAPRTIVEDRATLQRLFPGFEVTLFADDDLAHDIFSLTIDSLGRVVVSGPGYVRIMLDRDGERFSQALARTEVMRALLSLGPEAVRRGHEVLLNIDLVRVNDRVLSLAGELTPPSLRSLDAIHLATARLLGGSLARLVTYDERMLIAARLMGVAVASPG